MSGKVFISYRREDSAGHAGRIHDRLVQEVGRDRLFMDVDSIPLGRDFVEIIQNAVAQCDVLLAIIGPQWLTLRGESGARRLDEARDFVRLEIAAALTRDVPVVPVLLEGTPMPHERDLPDDLKGLSYRNALELRHASFHGDMDKLVAQLRQPIPPAPASPGRAAAGGRLADVERLIEDFYQPLKARLEKDNAIWRRIVRDKASAGSLQDKVAATIEREHVFPNHDEIIALIDRMGHLVDGDAEMREILAQYLDHIAVFKSIRAAGDDFTYPDQMGAPWPARFYPLVSERLAALSEERDRLRG